MLSPLGVQAGVVASGVGLHMTGGGGCGAEVRGLSVCVRERGAFEALESAFAAEVVADGDLEVAALGGVVVVARDGVRMGRGGGEGWRGGGRGRGGGGVGGWSGGRGGGGGGSGGGWLEESTLPALGGGEEEVGVRGGGGRGGGRSRRARRGGGHPGGDGCCRPGGADGARLPPPLPPPSASGRRGDGGGGRRGDRLGGDIGSGRTSTCTCRSLAAGVTRHASIDGQARTDARPCYAESRTPRVAHP